MIFPYKTDLPLFGKPYVSIAVIALCVFVFIAQSINESSINDSAALYCESIHNPELDETALDFLRLDVDLCAEILSETYTRAVQEWIELFESELINERFYSVNDIEEIIVNLKQHKLAYAKVAPLYLKASLMHYPDSLNPIPMLTSALAHSDFDHLFFNAIFFLAFAPALELLINNTKKFIVMVTAIGFITSLAYAMSIVITYGEPLPSLGLSGVVMGMIGLSGYLIPKANIGLVFWYVIAFKRFFLPVWVVAAWYIGWDIWDMLTDDGTSGVGFVSHAAGGLAGYFIGVKFFYREKKALQEELAEAIDEATFLRTSGKHSGYSAGERREQKQRQLFKQSKKAYELHMDEVFRLVRQQRDSDAIVLLLNSYEQYASDPTFLENMFNRVMSWGPSRTGLCVGRMLVHILCTQKKYSWAYRIAKQCIEVTDEFVYADKEDEKMMLFLKQEEQSSVS